VSEYLLSGDRVGYRIARSEYVLTACYFPGCLKYFCKNFGSGGAWFFWIGIR
jgi:hypothetical protein